MEPKVNYILVGAFVVLLGATILGAIFWLGKTDYRGIYDRYYVYTRESVAGLSVDSTVKYRGVDVGRVKQVILNPENAEEVRQLLEDGFEELGASPYTFVSIDERGVFVRFDQRLLFRSGSADLGADSDAVLLATNEVLQGTVKRFQ